jgi:hypothetical protein
MKLAPTVIAGALAITASMLGCSEDAAEPAQSAGTSGRGSGATGGGGGSGSGGSSGAGGVGASGGAGGSGGADARADADAGQCSDRDQAEVGLCKSRGNAENLCSSLVDCSCDKCACVLGACERSPGCLALRRCVLDHGCCSPALAAIGCIGEGCDAVCITEISAAAAEVVRPDYTAFQLALDVDNCVFGVDDAGAHCDPCPRPDAGDAAGGG